MSPAAGALPAAFLSRVVGWVLLVAGGVGCVAATVLMVEKVRLLENPTRVPSCTINAVLSCGSVMTSEQAEAFGFPNPLIGIAGFGALAAFGLILAAGVVLPRGLWFGLQAGVTFAAGFVTWLFVQSVYRIGALCPYCLVVWVCAIAAFVYVTATNVATGRLPAPRPLRLVAGYHGVVLTAWLALITVLSAARFWDEWP